MSKISIIIPVYNSEQFLSKCLISCIYQTYTDLEIIVVIDGSLDKSFEIARSFQEKDKRIIIINKENEGLPRTRRVGFENSKGSYIFHLDADDYISPQCIEVLYEKMISEEADIVVGGTRYESSDGKYLTSWVSNVRGSCKADYLKDIFDSNLQPNIWGRLIRRDIFVPVIVPKQYNCGEDYIANILMICLASEIKISTVPTLLYHYLVYKDSLTNTWPAEVFMPYTDFIEKVLIEKGLEEAVIKEWAYFRVIKVWRYYLRRGGRIYLQDKKYINVFYNKYYKEVRDKLSFLERIELNIYLYNKFAGRNFSKILKRLIYHKRYDIGN